MTFVRTRRVTAAPPHQGVTETGFAVEHDAQSIGAVRVALATSLGVALATFGAAAASNSTALFALSVEAFVACSSLLLVFAHAARRVRQVTRHGRHEAMFWSHGAPLFLFSIGAGALVTEGLHKAFAPAVIADPVVACGAGTLAFVLAALALWTALDAWTDRRSDTAARSQPDKELAIATSIALATLASAALALAGILATHLGALDWADGAAAIAIGLLLAAVAAVTSLEVRKSLVAADAAEAAVTKAVTPPSVAADAGPPPASAATAAPLVPPPVSAPPPKQHSGIGKGRRRR